jgi:hypothetical protein
MKIKRFLILAVISVIAGSMLICCSSEPLPPIEGPPSVGAPSLFTSPSLEEQIAIVFSRSRAGEPTTHDYGPRINRSTDYATISVDASNNSNRPPNLNYTARTTRALSSITDFTPTDERPRLGKFGGDLSRPANSAATGFFHVEKDENNRWWMVCPEGYRMKNIGLTSFRPATTNAQRAGMWNVYGDDEAWAKYATANLKDNLGFNGLGSWSRDELVMRFHPFPYTKMVYFVTDYASELGMTAVGAGAATFMHGVPPVFDPAFEEFADRRAASSMTRFKDDPYLIGWYSDNELPITDNATVSILFRALSINANDELGKYTRAVAWEWLRRRHGIDYDCSQGLTAAIRSRIDSTGLGTVDGSDRDAFREFLYDYYAQIVSTAIRRHAPNQMFLGPRIHGGGRNSAGILRAFGRYCQAIAINYYDTWEPNFGNSHLHNWERWSGRPVIITEWYTKGHDTGLPNTSGAGWTVRTQNDRGLFYEQFILALIESGSVAGWHWFRYKDNDPTAPAPDPSNIDANKGIVNTAFHYYTDLTDRMRVININTYRLVDYFVAKNGR